jgi:glycerophosphoryl diester phosphodiesterase
LSRAPTARRLACFLLFAASAAAQPPPAPARPFHVIAHRGASAHAPENTLAAFEHALGLGVIEVELDVQLSRDAVPVLFHDRRLETKTPLRGRVRDFTAAELGRAEIGAWFDRTHPASGRRFTGTTLATLAEVFAAFGSRLYYHVELKDERAELVPRVLAAVSAAGLERRVMLTSFSREQLERARAAAPGLPLCWLLEAAAPDTIDAAANAAFAMVGIRARELTALHVRRAHARGLEIRAYGVADDAEMERALASGANGMTLDAPERLVTRLLEAWRLGE